MLGVLAQAKAVRRQVTSLARLNLELARAEEKKKATALGIAGGMAGGGGVLVFYGIGFLLAAAAAGLAEVLPLWASLIIVTGAILLVAVILGLFARRFARQASPPLPSLAIEEAERTLKTLRGNA